MEVKYFKSTAKTNRFKQNQKVWVRYEFANHLDLFFRWRGNGRWVTGTCDKFAPFVGNIKAIDVDNSFADRIHGKLIKQILEGE